MNIFMNEKPKLMLTLGIILVLSMVIRIQALIPNFSPIIALGLLSPLFLRSGKVAILVMLLAMILSDYFLGFHSTIFFVYGSIIMIGFMGIWYRNKVNQANQSFVIGSAYTAGISLVGAIVFFIITNFGVWLVSGLYPLTLSGLLQSFVNGIPFFRSSLVSTIVFGFLIFSAYYIVIYFSEKESLSADSQI